MRLFQMSDDKLKNLRTIEPIDPGSKQTRWDAIKNDVNMFKEVWKAKPMSETLCMKEAFILGIPGSFICGLATFLLTTNRRRVMQVSIISLPLITFTRFQQCRLQKSHERNAAVLLQKLLRAKTLTDGTSRQKEYEELLQHSRTDLLKMEKEIDQLIAKQEKGLD
ncbi:unnamed protein product [Didymodactylos carnosus]|uniref:Cytochrome c oxidase assembly protein COX20, mitochondrial n=1 Tax=Didymodactylos carnosus TaxID=1234261 RepID=A0A814B6Z1_9BILA|nr:unnamed protein product [Didymodactylos carnosus]CAF0925223.1 unnamed protein product [Didymodactylos carnosus]CAF3504920.1 unnamed protein product [Didymodactylos carnosus]CAF3703955.1 unnamed protein product [Didymodactylos carnosus]